jgi:hypothetical protein
MINLKNSIILGIADSFLTTVYSGSILKNMQLMYFHSANTHSIICPVYKPVSPLYRRRILFLFEARRYMRGNIYVNLYCLIWNASLTGAPRKYPSCDTVSLISTSLLNCILSNPTGIKHTPSSI